VLAYSSISQLGFMLLGLAAGSRYAGLFHLTTHACFKALLFLCAGSYIHQQGTNDMVAIGRAGGRSQRWTTAGLIVGGAALAGVPAFAGFFSKEAILAAMGESAGPVALGGAYLASLLTAYYTARMVLLIVRPNPQSSARSDPEPEGAHAHHAHGGDGAMTMSIVLLTLATLGVGFLGSAIGRLLQQPAPHPSHLGMGSAVAVAAFGIVLAWWDFGRKGAEQLGFLRFVPAARQLFERKWYIDEIYDVIAGGVMRGVSRLCAGIDARGLDAAADRVAAGALASGKTASDVQAGRLQFYIATAVVFVVIVAYVLTL